MMVRCRKEFRIQSHSCRQESYYGTWFFTSGGGIREVSSDRVYPDDVVNEVHADGLIFGGAIWDYLDIMKGNG